MKWHSHQAPIFLGPAVEVLPRFPQHRRARGVNEPAVGPFDQRLSLRYQEQIPPFGSGCGRYTHPSIFLTKRPDPCCAF
jgi:hypothetical protein